MSLSLLLLAIVSAGYLLSRLVKHLQDPNRSIPGPFLARFSTLWVFNRFYAGHWEHQIIDLHQKYGPIVRYGPDQYSISDTRAIKPIHGYGGGFDKSSFYYPWSPPGTTSLFKEQSNRYHGELRKRFAAMYSMTSVYAYESGVGENVELLCKKLDNMAGAEIDLAWWITCLAFDCIGVVTYGKRFGHLDAGEDVGNLSKSVYGAFGYGAYMGMFPTFHAPFIAMKRFIARFSKSAVSGKMYLDSFTGHTVATRRQERAADPMIAARSEGSPTSILDKFLDSNEKDPAYFTDAHMTMGLGANVTAGSDTTATTLTWALYHLVRNPEAMAKLRREIATVKAQTSSPGPISFRDAQAKMPYLDAIIVETLRLFPQTGFGLPREVPAGGAEVLGHTFPAGSVLSLNAWAMHYDPAHFDHPEQFRPERWLDADAQTRAKMNEAYFPFGLGARTCIGKNIASLVILKALPQLVEKFDYEVAGILKDGRDLPTRNIFLITATAFPAVVRPRSSSVV